MGKHPALAGKHSALAGFLIHWRDNKRTRRHGYLGYVSTHEFELTALGAN